jgi:hypothetical protein
MELESFAFQVGGEADERDDDVRLLSGANGFVDQSGCGWLPVQGYAFVFAGVEEFEAQLVGFGIGEVEGDGGSNCLGVANSIVNDQLVIEEEAVGVVSGAVSATFDGDAERVNAGGGWQEVAGPTGGVGIG